MAKTCLSALLVVVLFASCATITARTQKEENIKKGMMCPEPI